MLRRPIVAAAIGLCVMAGLTPAANATVAIGTITSQSGWRTIATLKPGVVEQRETIQVAGYGGARTLTRISWTLGNSHVRLEASAVVPSQYDPTDHSFGEGQISNFGASVGALAGINGDTFCAGCSQNGNDLLHGTLVHNRRIYSFGAAPEVGYTTGGNMVMGTMRLVPVEATFADGSASIAAWNTWSLPGGRKFGPDQLAVFTKAGARLAVSKSYVALAVDRAASVAGTSTTTATVMNDLLQVAYPYRDGADRVRSSATGGLEWVDAYRVSQNAGVAQVARFSTARHAVTGADVVVPAGGVVLVARAATLAAHGLDLTASSGRFSMRVDDSGWTAATDIMDGKYQMVSGGVARTRYPGWPDSWPWYCQGTGTGCVRAAVATARGNQGWMVVETAANGNGLTMPDFARVLAQLGATNVMGFDSNTHADFWRRGAAPITAGGWEPSAPATTTLRYQ